MTWVDIAVRIVQVTMTTEQCRHCGHFVHFTTIRSNDQYRYVRCPSCGTKWTLRRDTQQVRVPTPPATVRG